jgi:uncharacterized protein (TIGR03437 family)
MGRKATLCVAVWVGGLLACVPVAGEDWVRLGNSAIDFSLAGLATGGVERAWYGAGGDGLLIQTSNGKIFETKDFESWKAAASAPPAVPDGSARLAGAALPEAGAKTRTATGQSSASYAFGRFVYRSKDGGASWDNLTAARVPGGLASLVGSGLKDLAISPKNEDEVVVAGDNGVFRSMDGGKSWAGLNDTLPNLPGARIRSLPTGGQSLRLEMQGTRVIEWIAGEKQAWRPSDSEDALTEYRLRQVWTSQRGALVTAVLMAGDTVYTGTVDGLISVSTDRGVTWQNSSTTGGGPVQAFWVDPQDSRIALAVLGARPSPLPGVAPTHVLHTLNAGSFWDDMTANLPDVAATGIAADRQSGAVYVSTTSGVFAADLNLDAASNASNWRALSGLPAAPATDLKLDRGGNKLWVSMEGLGVFSTLAPHRLRDPRVVSSADLVARAAAPGALLSVLGARIDSASSGTLAVPVLAANDTASQIQIPFNASGDSVALSFASGSGIRVLPSVPLLPASPGIYLNQDGSPVALDAETGLLLDAMNPAHSHSRIQILATGLGQVTPEWPAGIAAPMENSPKVVTPVKASLDRVPVDVTRAVLAPGLIGFYLVEIEIPKIVNYGPAELYIEAGGQSSNRVRVYIEP